VCESSKRHSENLIGLMALDEQGDVVVPTAAAQTARRPNSPSFKVSAVCINLGLACRTAELGFLSYDNTSNM
jgi:hypothetical protein